MDFNTHDNALKKGPCLILAEKYTSKDTSVTDKSFCSKILTVSSNPLSFLTCNSHCLQMVFFILERLNKSLFINLFRILK